MFILRAISKSLILSGVAATTLVSVAGGAQAWDGRGHRGGDFRGAHRGHFAPAPHRRHFDDGDRYREHRRDRDRDLKRGLAIGLGVAILGGIIAAEANKSRAHQYYD
jgi:hypothetical protein